MIKNLIKKIVRLILTEQTERCSPEKLIITRLSSFKDYDIHRKRAQKDLIKRREIEESLIPKSGLKFKSHGYCYVCQDYTDLMVDFKYSAVTSTGKTPNWRERLICPSCKLNNRMRATLHIIEQEAQPKEHSMVYISEQSTPLYKQIKRRYPRTIGSEYLNQDLQPGQMNGKGIRHESLTNLSFKSNVLDLILSFDVLEHIPDYKQALRECFRCLKADGILLFSVPFVKSSQSTITRAATQEDGKIMHFLPPEYHGDPLNPKGCLCFYHFGWDLLEELREIGFKRAEALNYWSNEYGYLGGEQIIFMASK
jgi:SAM-dependent methyltransferase